jgi:hypothetical protein
MAGIGKLVLKSFMFFIPCHFTNFLFGPQQEISITFRIQYLEELSVTLCSPFGV